MNLRNKRLIASRVLKVGFDRVWFDPNKTAEIKEAITRDDIRKLIVDGSILVKQKVGISRGRARMITLQKRKGRMNGSGSKKGKRTSRLGRKEEWVNRIRAQRNLFSDLVENGNITSETYRILRAKAKGGFFRSRRHIKLYLTEHSLWVKK
ncbi:50S ribosomal protein L19e [Candidatus Woesearchaeota archaeon]|nr:50S ribosomal protein L19e [Candidatus Woesearchaeota archaeon]